MAQQRCNTPGGIDQNESVSQQSRTNKNINFQKNKITNSRQRCFYFRTQQQPKKDNTKKAGANKNKKNKPVPTIAKKPKMYPWRQLLVVSLHRRHHDTNRSIIVGGSNAAVTTLANLIQFIFVVIIIVIVALQNAVVSL